MNKMKKAAKISLWTVGIILFLLLLGAAVFCYAFVSKDPEIVPAKLTEMDYFTGAKISQQILYRTLKSKNRYEIRSIKIRNEEMSSLMNLAENGESLLYIITGRTPKLQKDQNEIYKIAYERGVFSFKVKLTDTWCGLCFVASGSARVRYDNGKIDIQFISLKIGRAELPEKYQEKVKEYIYNYLKTDRVYDAVRASVLKIDTGSDGDVMIYYHPYRLRKYFKNSIF